jgi:hypothetical protein
MKTTVIFFALCLFISSAHSAIIQANYTFDGSNFILESGDDIFTVDYQVGDTLQLTISALGEDAYWDFSEQEALSFRGFDLGFTESGYRGIDGMYRFFYDDELLVNSYFYTTLDDYHNGPYALSVRDIDFVDQFSIDYRFLSSWDGANVLASFDTYSDIWSIWNTFGVANSRVPFVNSQSTPVSEPASLLLILLSLLTMIGLKRRKTL